MEKQGFMNTKTKLSKENFMGKKKINVSPILLKTIGDVEIYELSEYNLLEFCNFMIKFLDNNKDSLEKGEMYYTIDDRLAILNMFTNINLQNFSKNDILEILISPSLDVEECEKQLLQEIIPELINKASEDGMEQLLNMSKDEQLSVIKQIKQETDVDVNENEILKGLDQYKQKQELIRKKEEIEKQLKELGE